MYVKVEEEEKKIKVGKKRPTKLLIVFLVLQ